MEVPFLKLAVVASGIALAFVVYLVRYVLAQPQGTEDMARLSTMIQEGASAFLRREYVYVVAVSAVVVAFLVSIEFYNADLGLSWRTAVAFMVGAGASASAGFLGMYIATRANARTTAAAESQGVAGRWMWP